jgi:hypothetical protein
MSIFCSDDESDEEPFLSKEHKGLKTAEHCEECQVQLVFKARLHKYIQVEGRDVMEVDSGDNLDWRRAAEMNRAEIPLSLPQLIMVSKECMYVCGWIRP